MSDTPERATSADDDRCVLRTWHEWEVAPRPIAWVTGAEYHAS